MKIYFSSTSSIPDECLDVIGAIETSSLYAPRTKFLNRVNWWCFDSGTFTKPFDENNWKEKLLRYENFKSKCSFVVVPDVVYDYKRTLDRFYKYRDFVKNNNYPCAFVTQDGISIEDIPFEFFDVLFIGGSNEHKLGEEAQEIINIAKILHKPIHVGRVNSKKRLHKFSNCDSWDGSHLGFYPKDAIKFAEIIRNMKDS